MLTPKQAKYKTQKEICRLQDSLCRESPWFPVSIVLEQNLALDPESQPAAQIRPSASSSQSPRTAQGPCHHFSAMKPPVLSHLSCQPRPPFRCVRTTTRTRRPPSTARSTWSSKLPTSTCPCLTTLTAVMGL